MRSSRSKPALGSRLKKPLTFHGEPLPHRQAFHPPVGFSHAEEDTVDVLPGSPEKNSGWGQFGVTFVLNADGDFDFTLSRSVGK